jgi:hypothetical protein
MQTSLQVGCPPLQPNLALALQHCRLHVSVGALAYFCLDVGRAARRSKYWSKAAASCSTTVGDTFPANNSAE